MGDSERRSSPSFYGNLKDDEIKAGTLLAEFGAATKRLALVPHIRGSSKKRKRSRMLEISLDTQPRAPGLRPTIP